MFEHTATATSTATAIRRKIIMSFFMLSLCHYWTTTMRFSNAFIVVPQQRQYQRQYQWKTTTNTEKTHFDSFLSSSFQSMTTRTRTTTTRLFEQKKDNNDNDQNNNNNLPTAAGVMEAYQRLQGKVVPTPLLESQLLNQLINNNNNNNNNNIKKRVFIKAECLQHTGSFKYRGALNRLLELQNENNNTNTMNSNLGVVAFSSGNFGQALAAAATSLQIPCTIVSPHDAPKIKLDRIQQFGAKLVLSTANATLNENREVIASALAQDISKTQNLTLLHPFEDAHVIHGQGTCGMEIIEQLQSMIGGNHDESLFSIVVPCGGGGLTAGINLAVEAMNLTSRVQVYTIEPKGFDDHVQSFRQQERLSLAEIYPKNEGGQQQPNIERSVYCDALMAGAPGTITWKINQPRLTGTFESMGDDSAARAMKVAFDYFRLVLEPSGALGLAAVLDGQIGNTNNNDNNDSNNNDSNNVENIVVIASGGNTDMETFAKLMGCSGMV